MSQNCFDLHPPLSASQKARLLVVDDEPSVLEFIEEILLDQGYLVEAFSDPLLARDRLARQPHPDLLVSDVRMPKLDGGQLAAVAHELLPDLPILFVSGYPSDLLGKNGPQGFLLTKPFLVTDLLAAVFRCLSGDKNRCFPPL